MSNTIFSLLHIVFLRFTLHNRVHLTCGMVNEFEAFIDGVLRSKRGDNKFSIVETKKASRRQDPERISIQETCTWLLGI